MNEDLLNELFDYNGNDLTWKIKKADKTLIGSVAGWIEKGKNTGYRRIEINGKKYQAHRLVLMWHGVFVPDTMEVDHKNQNRTDNRINNLRLVTKKVNMKNKAKYKNNTSSHTGIYPDGKSYKAYIGVDSKLIYLGRFKTIEQAVIARKCALTDNGFYINHN